MEKYYIENAYVTITKDDYEEGEESQPTSSFTDHVFFSSDNIMELINKVLCRYSLDIMNAVISEDGYIRCNDICRDVTGVNGVDITKWKNGEVDGYVIDVSFKVSLALNQENLMYLTKIAAE